MKATKGSISDAVDRPDPDVRFYLFHGPDEAQSRAFGERLRIALHAERSVRSGGAIRIDPAALVDQAGAMSLFGTKQLIWIEPCGDEISPAVEGVLSVHNLESPVVAIAGTLRKTSVLLKLAEAAPNAIAHASYVPEGLEAQRMVIDAGRRLGLKIDAGAAARVGDSCGNDQAVVTRELEKYALYVDASPQSPRELELEAIEAVGADIPEGELLHLADLALAGNVRELTEELNRLPAAMEPVPVVRSLQRRLLMLAYARSRVERGERQDAVMTAVGRTLFWKDKPLFQKLLQQWTAEDLARASDRAARLEKNLIFSQAPSQAMLGEELLAIARAARTRQ